MSRLIFRRDGDAGTHVDAPNRRLFGLAEPIDHLTMFATATYFGERSQ
jgi:hypothetical protein